MSDERDNMSDGTNGQEDQLAAQTNHANALDPLMLELLVCPLTKSPLDYDQDAQELISEHANLAYPVRDGVPVLLPSEARVLDEEASGASQ